MQNVIELKNLSVAQGSNVVLKNINITIERGEFLYLIGKTGSGKSSLLKVLYGEIEPHSGNAMVAGYQIEGLKRKEVPFLRRKLGIVFQDFQLLSDRSVNANLEFVLRATGWKDKQDIDLRIREVLERIHLASKGHKMPHELSGGEQQRVAVARALLNNPDIILADEPTGNLDPETSEEIVKLFIEIKNSGKTVVMATHDYSLFKRFTARTLKCDNGMVIDSKLLD
jgi:cell division transport system ATP-binding protein